MIRTILAVLILATAAAGTSALAAGEPLRGSATAYHACDGSTTRTALGTRAKFGEVANNQLKLGTWIEVLRPSLISGRRFFRVEDRGGPGFALDIYAPNCAWMQWWGRRTVTYRALGRRELWHGRPRDGWEPAQPGKPKHWNAAGSRRRAHAAQ
jgi:3D (Asp-Asp-Asp) domain-containing protein